MGLLLIDEIAVNVQKPKHQGILNRVMTNYKSKMIRNTDSMVCKILALELFRCFFKSF